jgi:hypothetical protein
LTRSEYIQLRLALNFDARFGQLPGPRSLRIEHRVGRIDGATMDYSSSINDENPAVSPWGTSPNSSPKHPRASSFPDSADQSQTPYGSNLAQNTSYAQDDTDGQGNYNRPESSTGADSVAERDDYQPETTGSVPKQPDEEQKFLAQQQQQASQKQEPQRYHGAGRQSQQAQAPAPQYKLQAKITGLERTGRKDPILRFDVHVSTVSESYT